jgi:uncharacterized membrane protein YgcG
MATLDEFISANFTNLDLIETGRRGRSGVNALATPIPNIQIVEDPNIVAIFEYSRRGGVREVVPVIVEDEEVNILPDASFERNTADVIRRVNNTDRDDRTQTVLDRGQRGQTVFDARIETVVPEIERPVEETPVAAIVIEESLTDSLLEPTQLTVTQINQSTSRSVLSFRQAETDQEEQNVGAELQDGVTNTVSQEISANDILLTQRVVSDIAAQQEELSLAIRAGLEDTRAEIYQFDPNTSLFSPPDAVIQSVQDALAAEQQSATVQDSGGDSGGDFSFGGFDYGGGGG